MAQATGGTASLTIPVTANVSNKVTVCARTRIGSVNYGSATRVDVTVYPWVDPGAPTVTTGYRVASTCDGGGMWCSTGVTAPTSTCSGCRSARWPILQLQSGNATTDFSNMPIGSAVAVNAFVCVVFDRHHAMLNCARDRPASPWIGRLPHQASLSMRARLAKRQRSRSRHRRRLVRDMDTSRRGRQRDERLRRDAHG